jgi:hypothetical protein
MVTEVAALGTRLNELRELGPEASAKFRRLSTMTDEEVYSTVYELLVGTAGVRKGLALEMLTPDGSRRTPEYRLHNIGVPASTEVQAPTRSVPVRVEGSRPSRDPLRGDKGAVG